MERRRKKTVLTFTIADEHLNEYCTGLAPAPARAHAPAHTLAHAHSRLLTCTIPDKHLNVHCTGLVPAPAQARAPEHAPAHALAQAHTTLSTNTHRSARWQRLMVRHHERQKAIRRHDRENHKF